MFYFGVANRCFSVRSVERNLICATFEDKWPQPKIGNLGTHTKDTHLAQWESGEVNKPGANPSTRPQDHFDCYEI